jgi:hypothetical protein
VNQQFPLASLRRGRPSKFGRPARPFTITLPNDVVKALRSLDADLSRAVVRLIETAAPQLVPRPPVELVRFGRSAIIVVQPSKALKSLPGVSLVPLPDGRALISLDRDSTLADFEIAVRDGVDASDIGAGPKGDKQVLAHLGAILREARQARDIELSPRSIIVLHRRRTRPHRAR